MVPHRPVRTRDAHRAETPRPVWDPLMAAFATAPNGVALADAWTGRWTSVNPALAHLRTRPGFVSYEAMQTSENAVLVIQTWETRAHFTQAAEAEEVRLGKNPLEEIVVAIEEHAGDVVLSSG